MAHTSGNPDWLANMRQIPRAWVSCGVVACLLVIHGVLVFGGDPESQGAWFQMLGLSRVGFLGGGIWRLLTHALLHGNWGHVAMNAMLVLFLGSRIEHMAGHAMAARTMLAGVIGGGIFHLLLAPGLLIGFSGAAMALLILLVTLSPESRMFPLPLSAKSLGLGIMGAALMFALVHPNSGLPGFGWVGQWMVAHGMGAWFQVGHACHLGGGLAGWLCGRWLLRPRVSLAQLQQDRAKREKFLSDNRN